MNRILSFLFSKKISQNTSDKEENRFVVNIKKDGTVFLDFILPHIDDKDCENFALVLYLLNEGMYIQSILDSLSEIRQKDKESIAIVNKIISSWSKLVNQYGISEQVNIYEKPVVSPTQFYKGMKND